MFFITRQIFILQLEQEIALSIILRTNPTYLSTEWGPCWLIFPISVPTFLLATMTFTFVFIYGLLKSFGRISRGSVLLTLPQNVKFIIC